MGPHCTVRCGHSVDIGRAYAYNSHRLDRFYRYGQACKLKSKIADGPTLYGAVRPFRRYQHALCIRLEWARLFPLWWLSIQVGIEDNILAPLYYMVCLFHRYWKYSMGYISATCAASGTVKWAYSYTVLPLKRFFPSIAKLCHMATCLCAYALGPSLVATCACSPHTCIWCSKYSTHHCISCWTIFNSSSHLSYRALALRKFTL